MKRVALALTSVALVLSTATACEDGPECLKSHTEVQYLPVFNGKTTTIQPVFTAVCDEYATEGESK